jgi:hypothetical protein
MFPTSLKKAIQAASISVGGGILMAVVFNISSGRWFATAIDFLQQSAFFAISFAAIFVGGVLGLSLRASLGNIRVLVSQVFLATAFLTVLYFLGFVDFGIFSSPERWNWLWFPFLGLAGLAAAFFTRT